MRMINVLVIVAVMFVHVQSITLNNGGYEDVYIVITKNVPENSMLLDRIKEVFTNSSKLLFSATDNKVYFKSIKVIVPEHWSMQSSYQFVTAIPELETKTYIKIKNTDEVPFVKHRSLTCGVPGRFMVLPSRFLLANESFQSGRHENVIVHEWGHLRWGLFDEYPEDAEFRLEDGKWKPNSCAADLTGNVGIGNKCKKSNKCNIENTREKLHNKCKFCPGKNQSKQVSIMGYQYIDALSMFCDKNDDSVPVNQRHNDKAATKQNKICKNKSSWEVMREHPDFESGTVTLPPDFDTEPEFTFIKQRDVKVQRVFVLDVSGSMDTNDRIGILHRTGEYIIDQLIENNSGLGIVWFGTSASRKANMTEVKSDKDREFLKQLLPTSTFGSTCIGCGIEEAIEMMIDASGTAENGQIILITDGGNNKGNLSMSREVAVEEKVVIHTIAVSQNAETTLTDIATETGGKQFSYLETETDSFAMVLAKVVLPESINSEDSESVTVKSEKSPIPATNFSVDFLLEEGLGKDTSVTVLVKEPDTIKMQVKGPKNYTQALVKNGTYVTLKIGNAQAGRYILEIQLRQPQTIEYQIRSHQTSTNICVVRVYSRFVSSNVDMSTGDLPVVLVDVTKCDAPVINATVKAVVDTGKLCTIDLHDNGADPDVVRDDGTYSGYILSDCLSSGRVNVKIYVNGNRGETYTARGLPGASSLYAADVETEVNEDVFQRVDITEELFITNYVSNIDDVTSPGRITDVSINNIESKITSFGESRNFTITWTATGDDKNIGQATSYEMKVSRDYYSLRDDFDSADVLNMTNITVIPQAAGAMEALKITVDAEKVFIENMYFAVRAVDENGNKGDASNIVSIMVAGGSRISGDEGHAVDEESIIYHEEEEEDVVEDDGQEEVQQLDEEHDVFIEHNQTEVMNEEEEDVVEDDGQEEVQQLDEEHDVFIEHNQTEVMNNTIYDDTISTEKATENENEAYVYIISFSITGGVVLFIIAFLVLCFKTSAARKIPCLERSPIKHPENSEANPENTIECGTYCKNTKS